MAQIEYIPPKQCRHTFLTLLLHKSKNIMVVKEAAGHSQLKTTNRYAKILNEDVVSGLEKMDQEEVKESKVLEFKK
jgi:site-specific recombinase XerD